MIDVKLMKVLECCANDDCGNCPTQVKQCRQHAMLNALDLINRQKAEIDRLKDGWSKERFTTELRRIKTSRNTIREKLVELGIANSTDKIDTLATAIEGIINRGAISVTLQEGETYTIAAGYHNGGGTVSCVAGGGNYNVKEMTEEKKMCEKCLYRKNCQFLATHKKAEVAGCTAFVSEDDYRANIKTEAIKEFAERLKETKFKHGSDYFVYAENIDNLVKEMTEEAK